MATIHIGEEMEMIRCWQYPVRVQTRRNQYEFTVRLDWLDYDHWSHGRVSPSVVVDAVIRFMLTKQPPEEMSERFDCAKLRMLYPEMDEVLPGMF
jgi:hypothetical protein